MGHKQFTKHKPAQLAEIMFIKVPSDKESLAAQPF
jgi:hypothetical protein